MATPVEPIQHHSHNLTTRLLEKSGIIRARAPLRLGLAGGGTDIIPYCDTYGGQVLNATIDRYAYTTITLLKEPCIRFVATDQQTEVTVSIDDNLELNGQFDLHKAVYREMISRYNGGQPIALELHSFCDAPVGSGLGSSSALVVVMIRALSELFNAPLDDYQLANLAFKIERVNCKLQGGKQDQFSATFGGFNFMEFHSNNQTIVNPLRIKNWIICELEANLILFYMGISRKSAQIIADQSSNIITGKTKAIEAMHAIKHEALTMKECLLKGDFTGIVEALKQGWKNKKRSSKAISNLHIDKIYEAAIKAGALAGKISGAGGGGFFLFFVPPDKRMDLIRVLNKFEGQVSNCHFTNHGTQAWKL